MDLFYNNYTEKLIIKNESSENEKDEKDENTEIIKSPELIYDILKIFLKKLITEINKKYCPTSKKIKFDPILPPIIIPLPILPLLQLRIIPTVYLIAGFNYYCYNEKQENGAFLHLYVKGEVSLNLELGFYIPGYYSPVELAIAVGLKGVLGSGTIGLKLEYNLNQNQLEIELYYQFEAFALYFYIQYRYTIDVKLYTLRFDFYIVNQRLFGIYMEKHKRKTYNFLK